MSSDTFNMFILQTQQHKKFTILALVETRQLSASILRDFSKKTDKKRKQMREQKHFIVLYIWKYTYVWILKKMYMLTNLWQNILCKAQYLKLQYFCVWEKNKTYQKDFKMLVLHCARGQSKRLYMQAGCDCLQKLKSCKSWSGHTKCAFSWTHKWQMQSSTVVTAGKS